MRGGANGTMTFDDLHNPEVNRTQAGGGGNTHPTKSAHAPDICSPSEAECAIPTLRENSFSEKHSVSKTVISGQLSKSQELCNAGITDNYDIVHTTYSDTNVSDDASEFGDDELTATDTDTFDSDSDTDDSFELPELDTIPLNMPEAAERKVMESYTVDDVIDHNKRVGWNEWFLYGRNVYNVSLIMPIVEERQEEYAKRMLLNNGYKPKKFWRHRVPIYTLKELGVSRKDLLKILAAVRQGHRVDLPRDEHIQRMKHGVELVQSELASYPTLTENQQDFLAQLTRWLVDCSNIDIQNHIPSSISGNPNDAEFKLPDEIMFNREQLRKWIGDWEEFDTDIPEEGAWFVRPLLNDDLGDTHAIFADVVSARVDAALPELEWTIDGEAAWNVIQTDLISNDATTLEQEAIIKTRATRIKFHDTEYMRRRRYEIAKYFAKHYARRRRQMHTSVESFMGDCLYWADRLDEGWTRFQLLCEMGADS